MTWQEDITIEQAICHGAACLKGTRIPASVLLDNLATGLTPEEIKQSYPSLPENAIAAALACAADLARE